MKSILIVDDQADVRRLLEIVLRAKGRHLVQAESGEEAIEVVRQNRPDLILLDVMMPGGMDGYETTRLLKEDPAFVGCPIIAMTAKVQEQDRIDALEAGADDYIGKPFDMAELKEKVERYLD